MQNTIVISPSEIITLINEMLYCLVFNKRYFLVVNQKIRNNFPQFQFPREFIYFYIETHIYCLFKIFYNSYFYVFKIFVFHILIIYVLTDISKWFPLDTFTGTHKFSSTYIIPTLYTCSSWNRFIFQYHRGYLEPTFRFRILLVVKSFCFVTGLSTLSSKL